MAASKQRSGRVRQRGTSNFAKSKTKIGARSGVASRVYDAVLALSGGLAQERMALGADKIQSMAEAARDFGRSMADFPEARNYVAIAANTLEGVADYVSETDLAEMVEDAGVFARRHPVAVMCAGIAGGLLATQLLRANVGGFSSRRKAPAKRRSAPKRPIHTGPAKKAANGRAHADA